MSENNTSTGRYDVTVELGRGSMGIVCLAHDPVMGRDLAIKTILLPHGLPAEEKYEYQQRFLREAQAAGRLSHPGIVTIYDFNQAEDDGLPYIAMEYVAGYTLHELIVREGALESAWSMNMADTLADALQTAHAAGVVHRDLKPANILVRESDGAAKITDFGIARVNSSELTQAGTTYGSPAYMAPERIKGQRADARSDLYSLAVILYESLCGQRPFNGEDFTSLCYAIVNDPPTPIRTVQPELSIAFDAFFRRALAKDPNERYPDGASFRRGLDSVRLQQSRFETGAATLKLMTSMPGQAGSAGDGGALESTPESPGSNDGDNVNVREIPWRWVAIGSTVVLAVLLSFVTGWLLNRGGPEAEGGSPVVADGSAVTAEPEPTIPPVDAAPAVPVASPPAKPVEVAAVIEPPDPGPAEPRTAVKPDPEALDRGGAGGEEPVVAEVPADGAGAMPPDSDLGEQAEMADLSPLEEYPVSELPIEPLPADDAGETISVGVNVKNNIKHGTLTLLVDGEEVFATDLSTDSGQKLKGAYKKVLGKGQQQLESEFEIPAGKHKITALAYSTAKDRQYETSLDVDLKPGDLRTLRIVAGRTLGRQLTLKID